MAGGPAAPASPLPAASILLLRDATRGMEVLMMERHGAMGFAGGAMVFPGGKIDASDEAPVLIARSRLPVGEAGTAALCRFWLGALRELFEEAGILLASDAGGAAIDPDRAARLAEAHRRAVEHRPARFAALLETEGLYLEARGLVHFAHWITPEPMPRRFDTHFFASRAAAGQQAVGDDKEAVRMIWIAAAKALEADARGAFSLMLPTRLNLQRIAGFATVEETLAAARQTPVVPVMPTPLVEDGQLFMTIPAEAGYGAVKVRREDMPEAAAIARAMPKKGAGSP